MSDNSLLCYCAAVRKQLQPEILTQVLDQLILYNEILQVRFENGKYEKEPERAKAQRNKLLSIYDCAGKSPAEIEILIGEILRKSAGEIRVERGASIRAALLNFDQGFNKLLLLSHRAVVDGRGIVLLLEDLYRIYEQLSNGKKVALRPAHKTYLEFMKEGGTLRRPEFSDPSFDGQFTHDLSEPITCEADQRMTVDRQDTAAFSIALDKNFKRRLLSRRIAELKLTSADILAGATLRSLARADQEAPVDIWIKSDFRFVEETLTYTAGPLTGTYRSRSDFATERDLFSDVRKLRGILLDIPPRHSAPDSPQPTPQFSKRSNAEWQLRLNLEYLTAEPWLGGDEWAPEGFIMTEKGQVAVGYTVEIIPALLSDGVEILVEYRETPAVRALVDKFAVCLPSELEAILRYCEGYVDKRQKNDEIASTISKDTFSF